MKQLIKVVLFLVLALSISTVSLAQQPTFQPAGDVTQVSSYSSQVEKDTPLRVAPTAAAAEFRPISIIVTFEDGVDLAALEAASGGKIVYRYTKIFNGASLVMPEDRVAEVAALPGVAKVYLDELMQPDTERSPEFIGAPYAWNDLGGQGSAGEGVIVGVLDTGIWPEHLSFSDPDPAGKSYAPPPVMPGSNGFGSRGPKDTCDFGNTAVNPNDADFSCNNKLIGAYNFLDTYKSINALLAGEFDSARDDDGHGTHTTSTAAGNGGVEANLLGIPRGVVSGIAPRAHVIMYRVCADVGCYSSDSAAAMEQAILDEVDAVNFSISGGSNPYSDIVSLAFLAAYENGVFVAASAGNSGPTAETVAHREPWVTTVAASTSDRHFFSTLSLTADNGDTLDLQGTSVTDGISTPTAVIFPPASADARCLTPFAPGTFNGEIVICQRGINARVSKSFNVAAGGAGGMILYNTAIQSLDTDNHFIPTVHLSNTNGANLLSFMAGHTGVMATFTQGIYTPVLGDTMAAFSSRGGPGQVLGISKPDITAPGVQILAGMSPMPATEVGGLPGQLFQAIPGTSMSSPHVAGSAALVKALHPDWTPGQIKSALMTSASGGVLKEDLVTPATPFDTGSGRVNLKNVLHVGLTFDESGADYVALKDQLWNSNYPSLYVPVMPGKITVTRTAHSVASTDLTWMLTVSAPADLKVTTPRSITIPAGGHSDFYITVDASLVPIGQVRHATLFLKSKLTTLRFPITIVRRQPVVTLTKTCDPAEVKLWGHTACTISAQNNSFSDAYVTITDNLPGNLQLASNTLVGASPRGANGLEFMGPLQGAEPPIVMVAAGTTPAGGYLPLSAFGITPIAGFGDETIINFTVPSFMYAGASYARLGIVSNGYAVVGGGVGADVQFLNQNLPNTQAPNNVLAPFWSDLNPAFGGAVRIGTLTDGVSTWIVVDWEGVVNYSDRLPNDFQIWIRVGTVEDISFGYDRVSNGDLGLLTVGAENSFGNSGQNFYYNGTGTLPGPETGVVVTSEPAAPGEIHNVTFKAKAVQVRPWTNCAYLSATDMQGAPLFQGVNAACFSGTVVP